ncbi:MAG TPA: single-stranded-DNA-specific exonuclease RecJ, partial [Pirellulales bacterium]|nr:single-stranded-DNA-specific exonuclease RecJ [Pirellulales bacterium]
MDGPHAPAMTRLWRIHPHDSQRVSMLERAAGVPPVVAQLLLCRGIAEPDRIRDFLDCKLTHLRDPELLPGIAAAVDRIDAAIRDGRTIALYGDYDVDGITGISLLWQCLKLLGAQKVVNYVPHRIEEGYGLNDEALRNLASQGVKLVITVDCGIASIGEARTARELGLELIVTDHHEFANELPDAAAIVHPRLPSGNYPFGELSGAGVALKLAWALCRRASGSKKVGQNMRDFLVDAVSLAAIGTVADCVPLVDENRVLVQFGLKTLKNSSNLGLATLGRLVQLDRKGDADCEDIGFAIAPRLNAAGRLGQAQLAVELLTTTSPDRATALAEYINELNGSRQSLERSIYLAAHKQIVDQFDAERDPAFVLADHEWHPGVIGIVAGRLAEKFHRPVILISLDKLGVKPGTGSARSAAGLNLHAALDECRDSLLTCGGHAAAAGLKILEERVEEFRQRFCEAVASKLGNAPRRGELWIDCEVPLAALTLETVRAVERLAPFGNGNHRPTFCASGVTLSEPPKHIGGGGRHLALKLSQCGVALRGVAFGGGDRADELDPSAGPF